VIVLNEISEWVLAVLPDRRGVFGRAYADETWARMKQENICLLPILKKK
jgi:hypothetical protein